MIEEINKNLEQLNLERIEEILPEYIHKTSKNPPPLSESLDYLLNEEITFKNDRASLGIIKAANFPFRKTLDDYDFSFQPSVSENQIRELSNLSFIENHENMVFIGNSGVGKTIYITCGINKNESECPFCNHSSNTIHSKYIRTISDLPMRNNEVKLLLVTRNFFV